MNCTCQCLIVHVQQLMHLFIPCLLYTYNVHVHVHTVYVIFHIACCFVLGLSWIETVMDTHIALLGRNNWPMRLRERISVAMMMLGQRKNCEWCTHAVTPLPLVTIVLSTHYLFKDPPVAMMLVATFIPAANFGCWLQRLYQQQILGYP